MSITKKAVLSLSGGMDSSTLLLHLLANGYEVTALGFDYGQKHKVELERAASLVEYINSNPARNYHEDRAIDKFGEIYPKVNFQIIKLDGLQNLLHSSLITDGNDVPEGHYEQDNMKETVVPNRNKIFASLIQAVALSIATKSIETKESLDDVYKRYVEEYKREWSNELPPEQLEGSWLDINKFENLIKTSPEFAKTWGNEQEVVIAMGIHAGDHAIYPDCRQEFRDVDFEAFKIGNWDSELVSVYTPYLENTKFDIIVDGLKCSGLLNLDFPEIYKRTNTSYKPIQHDGIWYSDYKSASSVERIEAFIKLGFKDPVAYADETGPVSWEVAKSHVEKVLAEHAG
jgi:7-cyano-7-deazaguanine synthase in queuosine biosynthesis